MPKIIRDYQNLIKSEPLPISLGFIHTFFSGFGQTFFLALLVEPIRNEYQLSRGDWGFWYSMLTLASAILMFFTGSLIDRKSLKTFSLFSGFLLLAAVTLGATSTALWGTLFAIFLIRFSGQGLLSHIAQTTTARYFKSARGKALGVVNLGYPFSEMLLPLIAAAILTTSGWRAGFAIMGALLLFVFIPLTQFLLKKAPQLHYPQSTPQEAGPQSGRAEVIRDKRYWAYLPVAVTPPFLITGFFIHQSSLSEIWTTWNAALFSTSLIFFAVTRGSGTLFVGPLIDKFGARLLLSFYTFPIMLGCTIGASSTFLNSTFQTVGGFILFAFCGITAGIGGPIKSAALVEIWGSKHLGAIRSMTGTFLVFSTACSPWLFGFLLDHGLQFHHLLMGAVLLCLLSSTLVYWSLSKKSHAN